MITIILNTETQKTYQIKQKQRYSTSSYLFKTSLKVLAIAIMKIKLNNPTDTLEDVKVSNLVMIIIILEFNKEM